MEMKISQRQERVWKREKKIKNLTGREFDADQKFKKEEESSQRLLAN